MRRAMLQKNINKRTLSINEHDNEMSYLVWLVQKDFNVFIDESFPILKLFHYIDKEHISRYNKERPTTRQATTLNGNTI